MFRLVALELLVVGGSAVLAGFAHMLGDRPPAFMKMWCIDFVVLQSLVLLMLAWQAIGNRRKR